MELGDALRNLADLVDRIDGADADVVGANPESFTDDGSLIANVRVRLPPDGNVDVGRTEQALETTPETDDPAPGEGGGGTETIEETSQADGADEESTGSRSAGTGAATNETEPVEESADDDDVECTHEGCSSTFDTEHGMRIHRSKAHDSGGPERDADRLRQVYERHDSFEAMREALDVDVSAQTVRRWMMDEGIHVTNGGSNGGNPDETAAEGSSPDDVGSAAEQGVTEAEPDDGADNEPQEASIETESDDGAGSPPVGADAEPAGEREDEAAPRNPADQGSDTSPELPEVDASLPEGVTAADLCEAVDDASTLYDVQKRLELDRETARSVLSEYDLLELVHGRVADKHRREELKDEIDDRLEANTSTVNSSSD